MHQSIRSTVALFAFAATAIGLSAQPALKVVTVDMARLYDNYYKTEEVNAKLREAEQRAQEQIDQLNAQGNALVEEYKEMIEQSKNTLLNDMARQKAAEDAERKLEEIQRKQNEVNTFRINTQRSLQQRLLTNRQLMLEEISKVVVDLGKRKGATLIVDRAGPTGIGISNVLYADAAFDITEEALAEINRDRPVRR